MPPKIGFLYPCGRMLQTHHVRHEIDQNTPAAPLPRGNAKNSWIFRKIQRSPESTR